MNKKIIFAIIILLVAIVAILSYLLIRNKQRSYYNGTFPPTPTQQEREDAKKLPMDKCPCWDGTNKVCLPQADCI